MKRCGPLCHGGQGCHDCGGIDTFHSNGQKLFTSISTIMTLLLYSEECPVSGNIYNMGAGCFNRAVVVTGPGVVVGNGKDIPSPEDVMQALDGVMSMEGARPYVQPNDLVDGYGPVYPGQIVFEWLEEELGSQIHLSAALLHKSELLMYCNAPVSDLLAPCIWANGFPVSR